MEKPTLEKALQALHDFKRSNGGNAPILILMQPQHWFRLLEEDVERKWTGTFNQTPSYTFVGIPILTVYSHNSVNIDNILNLCDAL